MAAEVKESWSDNIPPYSKELTSNSKCVLENFNT
jgi:hypothetical protein